MWAAYRQNASARSAVAFRDSSGASGGYSLTPCTRTVRLGPAGEGGKVMCDVGQLSASASCLVLSVGSNGQVEFETAVHSHLPNCSIDVWDGTLTGTRARLRKALPGYVRFVPTNFGGRTWQHYRDAGRSAVGVLKIDCEGCEWRDLAPWLDNVCTSQLLVEMHMTPPTLRSGSLTRLLRRLASEFSLFAGEPNMHCGWRDSTTRACVELAWIRREPCPATTL
jgi:hypothetical protein